jgi:hypothetical protein
MNNEEEKIICYECAYKHLLNAKTYLGESITFGSGADPKIINEIEEVIDKVEPKISGKLTGISSFSETKSNPSNPIDSTTLILLLFLALLFLRGFKKD